MVQFSNSLYIYNHGEIPCGLGMWAFLIRSKNDKWFTDRNCPFKHYQEGAYVVVWATDVMSLENAKKEIKNWLTANKFDGKVLVAD